MSRASKSSEATYGESDPDNVTDIGHGRGSAGKTKAPPDRVIMYGNFNEFEPDDSRDPLDQAIGKPLQTLITGRMKKALAYYDKNKDAPEGQIPLFKTTRRLTHGDEPELIEIASRARMCERVKARVQEERRELMTELKRRLDEINERRASQGLPSIVGLELVGERGTRAMDVRNVTTTTFPVRGNDDTQPSLDDE